MSVYVTPVVIVRKRYWNKNSTYSMDRDQHSSGQLEL